MLKNLIGVIVALLIAPASYGNFPAFLKYNAHIGHTYVSVNYMMRSNQIPILIGEITAHDLTMLVYEDMRVAMSQLVARPHSGEERTYELVDCSEKAHEGDFTLLPNNFTQVGYHYHQFRGCTVNITRHIDDGTKIYSTGTEHHIRSTASNYGQTPEYICPSPYELEGTTCVLPPVTCTCDELKDVGANTCTDMIAASEPSLLEGLIYTYPTPNHNDAMSTLPNGNETNRCWEAAPETDGSVNSCPASAADNDTTTNSPIDCATGQKKYFDTDYQGFGLDALSYSRLYETPEFNSSAEQADAGLTVASGNYWQPRDVPSISVVNFEDGAFSKVFRLGKRIERIFFYPAGSSTYQANPNMRSIVLTDENGLDVVTVSTGQRFVFNSLGKIAQGESDQGEVRYTYTWDNSSGTDLLVRKANRFGRYLDYSYDANDRLITLTDQDGIEVHYEYDVDGNLSKVIYPDGTPADLTDNPSKTYLFEDANFTNYVTGILNQDGTRIANIAYDVNGKATLSELHNGSDRVEVSYPSSNTALVKFYRDTATNSYREEQYTFAKFRGKFQLTAKQITQCDNCDLTTETWDYNAAELLIRHTSPAGNATEWSYDGQDRKISTISGVGTAEQNTTTYTWNDTHNQVESITTATEITTYTFDVDGNRINTTVTPVQ